MYTTRSHSGSQRLRGAQRIELPAGTYTLTLDVTNEDASAAGDLDINSDLTINGMSAATTIIDGNVTDRDNK